MIYNERARVYVAHFDDDLYNLGRFQNFVYL